MPQTPPSCLIRRPRKITSPAPSPAPSPTPPLTPPPDFLCRRCSLVFTSYGYALSHFLTNPSHAIPNATILSTVGARSYKSAVAATITVVGQFTPAGTQAVLKKAAREHKNYPKAGGGGHSVESELRGLQMTPATVKKIKVQIITGNNFMNYKSAPGDPGPAPQLKFRVKIATPSRYALSRLSPGDSAAKYFVFNLSPEVDTIEALLGALEAQYSLGGDKVTPQLDWRRAAQRRWIAEVKREGLYIKARLDRDESVRVLGSMRGARLLGLMEIG